MTMPFACMGVREIQAGLATKEFSAQEVATQSLQRIAQIDGCLHAFLEPTEALALEAAKRIDTAISTGDFAGCGSLAGVPVAFKDNMNLEGTHTTCSSHALQEYVSTYTATCVQRIIDAGGIPLGKLNMDEFAFGSSTETSAFGCTRNPWDTERVPGGSSGGSAAAVAAGMATITLGSDTGGSIRQPGSFCGVVAVKPTYGAVSRYGVVPAGSSLDQVGPFTRSVEDAALALNVLSGRDVFDAITRNVATNFMANLSEGVEGMRIGVVSSFMDAPGLRTEVKEKIQEVTEVLRQAGANVIEVDLPHVQDAMSAYYVLGPAEAYKGLSSFETLNWGNAITGASGFASYYHQNRMMDFGAETCRRIMLGCFLLFDGVYESYIPPAQYVRQLIVQDYEQVFRNCDVILAPATPSAAFKFGEVTDPNEMHLSDMFTVSVNIAGNGGMSMPVGLGKDSGLPIGAQLISPWFKDENMLRVAAALELIYGKASIAPAFM